MPLKSLNENNPNHFCILAAILHKVKKEELFENRMKSNTSIQHCIETEQLSVVMFLTILYTWTFNLNKLKLKIKLTAESVSNNSIQVESIISKPFEMLL